MAMGDFLGDRIRAPPSLPGNRLSVREDERRLQSGRRVYILSFSVTFSV